MAREPSWQAVAAALADRVQHLAHCEDHRDDAADSDCAPCRDRSAYRMWQRKAGIDPHRAQEDAGEVIDVFAHARGDARYRSFGEADSPASRVEHGLNIASGSHLCKCGTYGCPEAEGSFRRRLPACPEHGPFIDCEEDCEGRKGQAVLVTGSSASEGENRE